MTAKRLHKPLRFQTCRTERRGSAQGVASPLCKTLEAPSPRGSRPKATVQSPFPIMSPPSSSRSLALIFFPLFAAGWNTFPTSQITFSELSSKAQAKAPCLLQEAFPDAPR